MSDAGWLWAFLAAWVILQRVVFPRLGVPT
jgi:hypothetical protein